MITHSLSPHLVVLQILRVCELKMDSPNNNFIERIKLAVQQLGDQLCIDPLHCSECNLNVNDGGDDMDNIGGSASITVAEAVLARAGIQNGAGDW